MKLTPLGERTARARARRKQWKLVSVAMLVHCLLQLASIVFIVRAYWSDERFERGAHLGKFRALTAPRVT